MIAEASINTEDECVKLNFGWYGADEYAIESLIGIADDLWDHVQRGELPEPTDGSALPIVKAANAEADPEVPVDIDDIQHLVADHADLKARYKLAKDELDLSEAKIRIAMGEATEAHTSDRKWRVRVGKPIRKFTGDAEADALDLWPEYGKTVLDRARFKEEQPELYEEMKRPTDDRRLTIKENPDAR
jgi:predicted phage-related endonuclease